MSRSYLFSVVLVGSVGGCSPTFHVYVLVMLPLVSKLLAQPSSSKRPEIPANTGNIGRTCVATGTRLHLIKPLGFDISDKAVKRAGLDYWPKLDVTVYESYEDFLERNPGAKIYYATTKGPQTYVDVQYEEDCFIMFGKESAGIPEDILYNNQETAVRIPMINDIRSLNLSNSVAIVLYEALRQNNFDHMQLAGHLRTHEWR